MSDNNSDNDHVKCKNKKTEEVQMEQDHWPVI